MFMPALSVLVPMLCARYAPRSGAKKAEKVTEIAVLLRQRNREREVNESETGLGEPA